MAKKPEAEHFVDMFANLGRDLKMPQVDVDHILDHHRKNLEALEKATRSAASGATDVFTRQREILEQTLGEVRDMAAKMVVPGSPKELMDRQTELAKKSFETAVKNASAIGEVISRSSTEAIDILRSRIKEAMEEMQKGVGKK
jgi:phasin family protein